MKRDDKAEYDAKVAKFIGHVQGNLRGLADDYVQLAGLVGRGSGSGEGPGDDTNKGVPVRLGVIDLMTQVERFVREQAPVVRGALRMGLGEPGGASRAAVTVKGLGFITEAFGQVRAENPDLAREIDRLSYKLVCRMQGYVGGEARPWLAEAPCTECGEIAVWVRPASFESACGACGHREVRSVSVAVNLGA